MTKSNIGLIGLGTMGAMLALNIAEKGFGISVFNRTTATMKSFFDNAGELAAKITPCETLEALITTIEKPRAIILMVPAGAAVDEQIAALRLLLDADDMIIATLHISSDSHSKTCRNGRTTVSRPKAVIRTFASLRER